MILKADERPVILKTDKLQVTLSCRALRSKLEVWSEWWSCEERNVEGVERSMHVGVYTVDN